MSFNQDPRPPLSSRFSLPLLKDNAFSVDNRPLWSIPGGTSDKIRFIQSENASSKDTYEPYHWAQRSLEEESSTKLYTMANKLKLDTSGASNGMNEIPVYEYGKDFTSDPILFVENVRDAGKEFGAVKVRMPSDFVTRFLRDQLIDPEAYIFRTDRVLNNPSENELLSRLRFFNELIKFHTPQNVPLRTPQDKSDFERTFPQSEPWVDSVPEASRESPAQKIKVESDFSAPKNETTAHADPLTMDTTEPQVKVANSATVVNPQAQQPDVQESQEKPGLPLFLSKLPVLDNRPLDLYDLSRFVLSRRGYDEVVNKGLWIEIGHELGYTRSSDQELSSFLEASYSNILRAFDLKHQDRKAEVGSLAHEINGSLSRKRMKLNNGAPLVLGSAKDFRRSVRLKASKGFLLNEPHLVNIKDPLVLGVRNEPPESNEKTNRSSRKTEEKHTPITSAAQINHYVKWLACGLANIQDASRYDSSTKYASFYSLKQYMLKDLKFQQYLMKSYPTIFDDNTRVNGSGEGSGEISKRIAIQEFERLYWDYIENNDEPNSLDGMKLESGCCVPGSMVGSGFVQIGNEFNRHKFEQANKATSGAPALLHQGSIMTSSQPNEATSSADSALDSASLSTNSTAVTAVSSTEARSTVVPNTAAPNTAVPNTNTDVPSTNNTVEIPENQISSDQQAFQGDTVINVNDNTNSSAMDSKNSRVNRADMLLSPFNIHNIPVLPNSLLGAYSALDVSNRDLTNSRLHIDMTFGTANWSCEDHFSQLCNYHSFGAGKRWYFIPELHFEKFESLVQEVNSQQNGDADISRVNLNYRKENWHFDELEMFIDKDLGNDGTEFECLNNSMNNMVNPYPEIRLSHKSDMFQKLIDERRKQSILLNQEFLITPQLLHDKGIDFTTTVQEQGEFIFTYPKTYSSSFSLGLNLNEEVNFASKLWLDYAEEGESWIAKQGILPNILIFRMLINFAQFHESNDVNCGHFDADIYSKVLSIYSKFLDRELGLRAKIRQTLKVKETTVEERNISDIDCISDDTLENAFPSKIVITEAHSRHQMVMTLPGFLEYAAKVASEENAEMNFITEKDYSIELQLLYSDEKLRYFQRLLSSYSVDFEGWLTDSELLLKSGEEVSMKVYKNFLAEGWKIYSAVASTNYNFKKFSQDTKPQNLDRAIKIKAFREEVENLQRFVDESVELVEECQAILSLKHQQRIRNHGGESTPQVNNQQLAGSLELLLELINKIPKLNFYTPEFDQIFEFKSEIENFDRACRALIQKSNVSISEFDDMISLGNSFGLQIPSLGFITRLRDRQKWLSVYETIISGGDPFSEKKDIFFLKDLLEFRDEGLRVLASTDIEKIKTIDAYVTNGNIYDATVTAYLLENSVLNKVDLKELDTIIDDMVERSKKIGSDRLFVTNETYSRILDLKAQSAHIKFLNEYLAKTHMLFDITQKLNELESCGFRYDSSLVHNDLARTHQWLDNSNTIIKQARIVFSSRSKPRVPILLTRHASDPDLIVSSFYTYSNCATAFAGEDVDDFTRSSSWVFLNNLDYQFDEKHPARYCMCRDFEDGVMIECDRCHEWYHVNCVNANNNIEDENEKYSCPVCLLLEAYKFTGTLPEIKGKICQGSITKLIAKGEELRIIPQPEIQALRDTADLVERAREYFEKQMTTDTNVGYGPLYTLSIARKFYGSPVCDLEQISKLFGILKDVDIPGIFKAALASRTKDTAQVQEPEVVSSDTKSTVPDATQIQSAIPVATQEHIISAVSTIPIEPPKIASPEESVTAQTPLHSLVVPILVSQKVPETRAESPITFTSLYIASDQNTGVPVNTKNEVPEKIEETVQVHPAEPKGEVVREINAKQLLEQADMDDGNLELLMVEPQSVEPKLDAQTIDKPEVKGSHISSGQQLSGQQHTDQQFSGQQHTAQQISKVDEAGPSAENAPPSIIPNHQRTEDV